MNVTDSEFQEQPPVHLRWEDYRRDIMWDDPDWGFQRGRSPTLEIEGLTAYTSLLPVGQGSRLSSAHADTVFVGGQGEAEVVVEGTAYVLRPMDVLHIPQGSHYSYKNISFDPVVIFEAVGVATEREPPSTSVNYQPWDLARRNFNWDLPMASQWRNHRAAGPHVTSDQIRGHLVQMPPGQTCPWHAGGRHLTFFQIMGTVEFHTAGEVWQLNRFDLFATRRAAYLYTNPTFEPTLFFDIGGPVPANIRRRYFESDPGFPIRSDATELTH